MRKVFQAELTSIGEGLITMSHRVATAMEQAWEAFITQDTELAQEVIAGDARIDFMQNELDERAIDVLALQGPVASDLRMIVGSLRMSASLERMGDLARHIAQLARLRFPNAVAPESIVPTFAEMAKLDIELAHMLGDLLDTRDLSLARQIIEKNRKIDELHSSVFRAVASPEWDASAETTADVTLTSRYLERFGDHGVSVTRKVTYLVTGEWEPESVDLPFN
ncbi:phosphate signaling complex protein PhoU [Pseudoglutamicibacter cumminsii]|uniref:Phosphate-specific transport system accessory protein PhoU n=1 Tax=Pseudoglutamicibacter cumminsii TaxID=156979 RepID=A0AAP4C711_9MICC|nr:phosphate signaling complex protein PhoU [Pseudoglutamicibacter cumminsii]MDK6275469.1 phosphate signaling complex protein PhoU [Pseudoglutamicibacter cumminsii]